MHNLVEGNSYYSVNELSKLIFFKSKGRPQYSSKVLRFTLMQRYSSSQAYSHLLEQLPLPSKSLLKKLVSGGIDSIKSLKLLLNEDKISNDCVILFDEIYLQQSCEYHSGRLTGQDKEGNLYKGEIVFMIAGLKKSIPCVIKAIPETNITGDFIKN